MKSSKKTGGGAATHSGTYYQNEVSAKFATDILAEKNIPAPWDLSQGIAFEFLRCETTQPTDDILIGTSEEGYAFIQAKHTLRLDKGVGSELAKTIDQFVRQFLQKANPLANSPWEVRSINTKKDRLVIATSSGSSSSIKNELPKILKIIRGLAIGQTIDAAAGTATEKITLSVIKSHVINSWKKVTNGQTPDNSKLKEFFNIVYVEIMDVDPGERDEQAAKTILSTAVLEDPSQSSNAWKIIKDSCGENATIRSGSRRDNLQKLLENDGIILKTTRSFQYDVDTLKDLSKQTLQELTHMSKISIGKNEIKILRKSTNSLGAAANNSSLVVVGQPGAGKSGALHSLADELLTRGNDVLYISADKFEASSVLSFRNEIGLKYNLYEVLANWKGKGTGFLIIDALDAARSPLAQKTFLEIISYMQTNRGRWNVIVSIRKYDLRNNPDLGKIFAGQAPSDDFFDPEFIQFCHLSIPALSDEEISEISKQSQDLGTLISQANADLLILMRNLFNLRLVADLLNEGASIASLSTVSTQSELLERYWSARIIRSDNKGDAREKILKLAVDKMVANHSLRIARTEISLAVDSQDFNDLLSSNVLQEWQSASDKKADRYTVTFSHQILFDYAVSRLLLRDEVKKIVDIFNKNPELFIIIRPSVVFHFQYLWYQDLDRETFWECVIKFVDGKFNAIGKVIGPSVAAELLKEPKDYEYLIKILKSDQKKKDAVIQIINYLVGAITSASDVQTKLVGEKAVSWCHFLLEISDPITRPLVASVCRLLQEVVKHPKHLTEEQREYAGLTARRMLQFEWEQPHPHKGIVRYGIEAVCRTFESDKEASTTLLRTAFKENHIEQYGFEEMPRIAFELKRLLAIDPEFVAEVYKVTFNHEEKSEDTTAMGGSVIMPMTSTRRQDFDMACYSLVEMYPAFLEASPLIAIGVLVETLGVYIKKEHRPTNPPAEREFLVWDKKVYINADYSVIWLDHSFRDYSPVEMFYEAEKYIKGLCEKKDDTKLLKTIIDIFVSKNRSATVWCKLLVWGAEYPETLGKEIRCLAWQKPLMSSYDTYDAIRKFINVIFPSLNKEEKENVEAAILSLKEPDDQMKIEKIKNPLLKSLPLKLVVTREAKEAITKISKQEMEADDTLAPTRPKGGSFDPRDILRGNLSDKEHNLEQITDPIEKFQEKTDHAPTDEEIETIFPKLEQLRKTLTDLQNEDISQKLMDHGWGYLVGACAKVAHDIDLNSNKKVENFVKEILLLGANHPHPRYEKKYHDVEGRMSWSSPSVRINAAVGLMALVPTKSADKNILEAISKLSRDDVPAVRYHVIIMLSNLKDIDSKLMWQIIDYIASHEKTSSVVESLIAFPMRNLFYTDKNAIIKTLNTLYKSMPQEKSWHEARAACLDLLMDVYLHEDNSTCKKTVFALTADPIKNSVDLQHILRHLRGYLTLGRLSNEKNADDEKRARAFILFETVIKSGITSWNERETEYRKAKKETVTELEREENTQIAHLLDTACKELYFASNAYEYKQHPHFPIDEQKKERFYQDAQTLFHELAKVKHPSSVHHLLETLEYFIPQDPKGVFLLIGEILKSAQEYEYQYESLGESLFVKIIDRYIAEYKYILQEDEDCQNILMEILDIFVEAGWESAFRLVYKLDEIYR